MILLHTEPVFIDNGSHYLDAVSHESCVVMVGCPVEFDPLLLESRENAFLG